MPTFLILGAGKAGTTALYHYLRQHPDVYMSPKKETNFFAFEGETPRFRGPGDDYRVNRSITTLADYQRQFDGVTTEKAIGEASPRYLVHENAPARIRHHIPDAKLIAVLRDPVERAYSAYVMYRREGLETCATFAEALAAAEQRIREGWGWGSYLRVGFYHQQLTRYLDLFDAEQLRIYLYEDFLSRPLEITRQIFGFIGVDESFAPDMAERHNVGGVPRRHVLDALLRPNRFWGLVQRGLPEAQFKRVAVWRERLRKQNRVKAEPLSDGLRQELIAVYREDICRLQDLIKRDLSRWLV
jgi:hypothetical protein